MKPTPPALALAIVSQAQMAIAELYTFTFLNGSKAYYTDLDIPISYDGHTYVANSLRIEGLKVKLSLGLSTDEQEIKISAYPGETLGGAAFFGALQEGLLDGAYLLRSRGFWQATSGPAYNDYAAAPLGVIPIFTGRVSTITKIGRTHVEMKLKSPMTFLDVDMPRNTYEPGCQWVLFDQGCTLTRASFTTSFTVSSAPDHQTIIPVGGISSPVGADGINNYLQGRLLFTSGNNNNLQVLMRDNDAVAFYLQYPLSNLPAPGDTFSASVGCVKASTTCSAKFSNILNFRGFERVPPIMLSV